jgi:hypothetical protein
MSTLLRDIGRSYGRAIAIGVIVTVVGLPLGCVYVFVPLWFMSAFDMAPWAIAIAAVLYLLPLGVVVVGIPLWAALRRKAWLDRLFVPLGLEGKTYQTHFRQYHSSVQGRQVDAYFYRGPVLEIEVHTTLQTRLGIARKEAGSGLFASLAGRQPLALADPALSELAVFAVDELWAQRLLRLPGVGDLLHRLTETSGDFSRQQVILRPGALQLMLSGNRRLFGFDLEPEQVRGWLEGLMQLAHAAEGLPAPAERVELSAAERLAQRVRQSNPYLALWIGLGTAAFLGILAVVVVVTVLVLSSLA